MPKGTNLELKMWHWDQGRLEYFQFDALRQIAAHAQNHDFRTADRLTLQNAIGLPFAVPSDYSVWRNYSRVLKLMLLVSEVNGIAEPTPVSKVLAKPGAVTCDEYLHFLLCAFTEPSPALADWRPGADFRYPLLFGLKYLLTKNAIGETSATSLDEIIGAYIASKFTGDEGQEEYISIVDAHGTYEDIGRTSLPELRRQSKESLKVISQISYLHVHKDKIVVSLNPKDAAEIFDDLAAIGGPRAEDRNSEIRRLASLFKDGSTSDAFNYSNTILDAAIESGFREGTKVKRTHITIERNASLRYNYFALYPTAVCDVCTLNTAKTYPWTEKVLDLHHLLPLCAGTRVEGSSTTYSDLVPVCPTCHRAVHRYYDIWLSSNDRSDFVNGDEAKTVYRELKSLFKGLMV